MKLFFVHIILLMLFLPVNVFCKNTGHEPPKWINEVLRKEMYPEKDYFVQFEQFNNVSRKEAENKKEEIVKLLQERLSKQIQTFISTKTLFLQSESASHGYNELFTKETKVVSSMIFFDSEPLIWFDKRSRKLFAMYAIKKKDLGEKYNNLLLGKLKALKNEIEKHNTNTSLWMLQNTIKEYEAELKELEQLENVIIASGAKPSDDVTQLFSKIKLQIKALENKLHSAEIEDKIRNAEELLADRKYEDALKAFRILSVDLPDDQRIINGIQESKTSIEQYYLYKIDQSVKREQFNEALNLFDKLFTILPEMRKEHAGELYELEAGTFDHISSKLDLAFKIGNIPAIKSYFAQLNNFRFINPDKVNRYKVKVDNAIAEDYFRQAKTSFQNHNYYDAISLIKNSLNIDSGNNKYKDLYAASKNKIYRYNLRQLKSTRHHIMAFQFGGGIQTHKQYINELIKDDNVTVAWLPSFSLGLFAKYGIRSHVTAYGRDLSRSNLIGFRYTFVEPKWNFGKGDIPQKELCYWQEAEFVIGFATKWLFETGIANNRLSTSIDLKKVSFYTASLTRRFYTHPMELTLQFKAYVSPDWDFYPVFKMGIFFDVNLIRKISRADKKRIKQEIAMIK